MEEMTERANESVVGYRKDVVEATGINIEEKLKSSEAMKLIQETASDREADLLKSWGGKVFKVKTEGKPDLFYLRRSVEGERQVAVVMELNTEITKEEEGRKSFFTKTRKSFYDIKQIFISGPNAKEGVELLDLAPIKTSALMNVCQGDVVGTDKAERTYFTPAADFVGGELVIDTIQDLPDAMSVVHELGHANILTEADGDQEITLNVARGVAKDGATDLEVNSVASLAEKEDLMGMKIDEALKMVKDDEHNANRHVDMFLKDTDSILKINDEERAKLLANRESNYQSYDQGDWGGNLMTLLFPGAAVSNRAQTIQEKHEEELFEHYQLFRKLVEIHEANVGRSQKWVDIESAEGVYKVMYNRSYLQVITPDKTRHDLSFSGMYTSIGSEETEVFSLSSFKEAEKTVSSVSHFVKVENMLLELLSNHFSS